ncbi:50S ribosomal protein L3 N(5)-glutamine methyltransferase [Dokdonella sp. MW10]|uniref:50S ribosomal protein L3 N(5)-glutamine methyltransferase n=1 Tax=Dokdonella sp. MW10 TaxID=2992926 RepID=UPI003F7D2ABF
MTAELASIIDFIRYGASRFGAAGLTFGHSYDNALDEATHLVLQALHLPHDLSPAYGQARLTADEKQAVLALFEARIANRTPVAYLTGKAWFAGLEFKSDTRALVPRSPIAELIQSGFSPWLEDTDVARALDLCTGSGCIGIAMASHNPDWQVDLVDVSDDALSLARENIEYQDVGARVRAIASDLFDGIAGERYDLIVSNPPYVTEQEFAALPPEYGHEPKLGLTAGEDGLDIALRILAQAPDHLEEGGVLIVEVGESEHALAALLPQVPFNWVEFNVGAMGVFVLTREDLVEHAGAIGAALAARG